MQTIANSILKRSALGCVLAVTLLHGAVRLYAQAKVGNDKAIPSGGTQAAAATAQTNSISGTWKLTIHHPSGDEEATFILKQEGEKVTGDYSGPGGKQKVTGTTKGKATSFTVTGDGPFGNKITQHFTVGTVSADKLEGTVTHEFKGSAGSPGPSSPGAPGTGQKVKWTALRKKE